MFPTGFRVFSHPAKDTFQLSITLLVNYRSRVVFRIGGFCPPYSRAISNARYSGSVSWPYAVRVRDFHPLWCAVPGRLPLPALRLQTVLTPHLSKVSHGDSVCPVPLSFATTYGISLISFPPLTEMFHFTGFAYPPLYIQGGTYSYDGIQVTPFGNPRVIA